MITLTDKTGQTKTYSTESYILLTVEGESIKAYGDVSLKSLTPLLMKILAEKFMKGQ